MSLGGTILTVAILAALASCLANLCVTHLRLSSRADNALHASNLARSAVAAAIARVAETPEFGTASGPEQKTISIQTEQGDGYLTFSKEEAEAGGFLHSTNNIGNTSIVAGAGGSSVPGDTVHLVGRGICQGVERRVEAVIKVPSYPWAVAATGEVEISSGATVGALPAGVWPPTEDVLEPADLVSNSSSTQAITLSGTSRVLGNVETPGTVVVVGDAVVVDGQIRNGAEPNDIPSLRPETYDPQARGQEFDNLDSYGTALSDPASPPGLHLTGAARRGSDLTVDGTLKLDAGSLYVDGDLTVHGNIEGYGVLVVTGDVTVDSGVALQGATQLALLAGGSVSMQGQGPASTVIRGIFYAEHGLTAKEMTVVGALIGGGEEANVRLENVDVYQQQAIEVAVTQPDPGESVEMWGAIEDYLDDPNGPVVFLGSVLIGVIDPPPPPEPGPPMVNGPSNFISLRERMKVVSWNEFDYRVGRENSD